MNKLPNLSIIISAYNEDNNIKNTIEIAEPVVQQCVADDIEWVLVDDGSTDSTWNTIEKLSYSLPNTKTLKHSKNQGFGAGIWTGISNASSDWCVSIPADGQINPNAIIEMARIATKNDLVLLMRNEDERSYYRRFLTRAMYCIMRLVLGFSPFGFSGVFLVRRKYIINLPLICSTGLQNMAWVLYCKKKNLNIKKVYSTVLPRLSGESKVTNISTIGKSLFDIVKLRFKFKMLFPYRCKTEY